MAHPNNLKLFASVLTHAAPSSNYRGESENNRVVLQKITKGGHEYAVISSFAMCNALREILLGWGVLCNRTRLHDEGELAVEFKGYPEAAVYADDFLFGFMVARGEDVKVMEKKKLPTKRNSVLQMNTAVALSPYRFDATFHQSPKNAGASVWRNAESSALFTTEKTFTAYQYPFAMNIRDCIEGQGRGWTKELLQAIGELTNVAGGQSRSYFEMAPRSIVARLTTSLVVGMETYGFDEHGKFPELSRLHSGDLPGQEFWLGGELVRNMDPKEKARLTAEGARLYDNPQRMIADISTAALGEP